MPDENKYVLRHEWVKSNGDIYEKINENDKNIKEIGELKRKLRRKPPYNGKPTKLKRDQLQYQRFNQSYDQRRK